jgi:hypothetical protein
MKFTAFVFLALSIVALKAGSCLAQQPIEQQAPATAVPAPAPPPTPGMASPPHHTRSLQRAPAAASAPAPAPASKPDSGTPDVVVGGLPGNQSADAVEKQP